MTAQRTCFISFTKLLFSDLTKRKTIYRANLYSFISFMNCKVLQLAGADSGNLEAGRREVGRGIERSALVECVMQE